MSVWRIVKIPAVHRPFKYIRLRQLCCITTELQQLKVEFISCPPNPVNHKYDLDIQYIKHTFSYIENTNLVLVSSEIWN